MNEQPLIRWDWIVDNVGDLGAALREHLELTVLAVLIGFAISFPLAVLAHRRRVFYGPLTWFTGILYTIPSLALIMMLVAYTGLSRTTSLIALVSYTLLILIRNIVAGLDGVPRDAAEAAVGMGYSRSQLLWRLEVPLALPAIAAGVRIATVTTIGLVTVTALIGQGGFGQFILEGISEAFPTATLTGAVLSAVLALVVDRGLVEVERHLTPWAKVRAT